MRYMTLSDDDKELCRIDIAKVDNGDAPAVGDYEWCITVVRDGERAERCGKLDGVSTRIGDLRLLHHVIGNILSDGRALHNKSTRGPKKPVARSTRNVKTTKTR
jgi:hypothetical protein